MEEQKDLMEMIKKYVLKYPKRILQVVIVIVFGIVLLFLAGVTYFLNVDDGTNKEGDWSSTPYVAGTYINNTSISNEGEIKPSTTTQEMWDKMLENHSRVDLYLDTPEQLAKLMKAEIVTKYPDTRPNPNEPINWDKVIADSDKLQGIIKFKRADSGNNKTTMIYTDPETFQGYIDEYNNSGSEIAKQNALTHFTLKQNIVTTNSNVTTEQTRDDQEENDKNRGKDKEDSDKNKENTDRPKATATQVNGDGYSQEYTSSAGITYKEFKQSSGSYAKNPYWDGTIANYGCGPTSVAILASGLTNLGYTPANVAQEMNEKDGKTSFSTLQREMNSLGMNSEVVQSPSAQTIQDYLRNGKVMLVSVNNGTRFTDSRHIMAIVDIDNNGQIYICNPSNSSGSGWFDVGEIMKGCNYIVVTDAGAAGIADRTATGTSNNTNSKNTVVVATWKETETTVTTNDPDQESTDETSYLMTTTEVNYESMVEHYIMPFDLLWALLVIGEDKNFVFELADLAYHSDIQITIYDNLTENTNIDEWNYTKETKADIKGTITAKSSENTETVKIDHSHDPTNDPDMKEQYTTTKTVITKTNTINCILTKANVWVVDYQNDYIYNNPIENELPSTTATQEDQPYPDSPTSTEDSYSCEHIKKKEEELKKQEITTIMKDDRVRNVSYDEEIHVDYYNRYTNITDKITNKISTQKYIKGEPALKEKTDRNSTEPNFVTIFRSPKYRLNRGRINDAKAWLFEIIENNDSTKNMLDLIKYLIEKANSKNPEDIEAFDFEKIFMPKDYTSLSTGIYGGNIEEKVWFTLRNLGYSEYAVAGVMGNMYGESGFDPAAVQGGGDPNSTSRGIGLCQWTGGRNQQLRQYAASKQKEWQDADLQIEFLIGELSRIGDAAEYCENQINDPYRTNWENAKSVEDATINFCLGFERCSTKDYLGSKDKRVTAAQGYYNQYKGKTWEGSSSAVVKEARGALGVPYKWGGESYTDGMDCSGLVKVCYQRALEVDLPHNAKTLMEDSHFTTVSSVNELSAGDIIVSSTHVGIYTGEGTVIHEPKKGDVCKEVSLDQFIGGKNYLYRHYNQ